MKTNYKAFENEVIEVINKVAKAFGENVRIEKTQKKKNNGGILHGIVIDTGISNMIPVIYLEPFYNQYEQCEKTIEEIVVEICAIVEEHGNVKCDSNMLQENFRE